MFKVFLIIYLILHPVISNSKQISYIRKPKISIDFKLNQDGSYEKLIEKQSIILNRRDLVNFSKINFEYVLNHEFVELIEASILKDNNKIIEVSFNNNEISNIQSLGNDLHRFQVVAKTLNFKDLEIGDVIRYKIKKFMIIPNLKGHFYFEFNSPYSNKEEIRISLILPRNIPLAVKSINITETLDILGKSQKKFLWAHSTQANEEGVGENIQVIVSTIKTYEEFAKIYASNSKEKSSVTKKIKNLADMLTKNNVSDLDKAKSIYQWVQKNISYKSPGLDINMTIPNTSEIIFDRRYGDCKDFVVIFESLLSAVGIESTPVLLNINSDADLPIIPGPKSFNHVITYIPSLNVYLDSTSENAPFGQLPQSERARPAVHVKNFVRVLKTQNF